MNEFKFTGDWDTWVKLNWFSKVNCDIFDVSDELRNKLIKLEIQSDLSDNPDPTDEQFNAINLFLSKEKQIYEKVFDELVIQYEKMKPRYINDCCEEFIDVLFPNLESVDDLGKIISLNNIHLTLLSKDNFAFITLHFSCTWDEEHGCSIVIHKDKIVQFNEGYDCDLEILINDSSKYNDYIKIFNPHIYSRGKYYHPNPKYNQLKPAQIEANKNYPFELIIDGKNEEFIQAIESNLYPIDFGKDTSFIALTCVHKNQVLFDYILSKKPKNTTGAIECCIYNSNLEFLEKLLNYGVDINENHPFYGTPLRKCMRELLDSRNPERTLKLKMGIQFLISKGADPYIKDLRNDEDVFELIEKRITQNKVDALDSLKL